MSEISPETYQHFRDRLSALLEKAQGLPGLLPENAKHMDVVRRKLYENQFEITLVGEFQGGKSTTFNNICDGREISPRGKGGGGLKTSGCIVRAQNLPDSLENEHAIVRWRTPEELLKGFDEILRRARKNRGPVTKLHSDIPDEISRGVDLSEFDLTTSEGRNRIRKAAEAEIGSWEMNPGIYDPDDIGLVDLIRFALLTAHFYEDPFIAEMRSRERFRIDEIQPLVTFPETWMPRWREWKPENFKPAEIVFAFVASVGCKLKSPNLSRLGCALTDCPGLFASNWDSQVATEALARADAVLYLVPGDRQLSLSDLKVIRSLTLGKGMILVGANCRALPWHQTERIREANSELLAKQGLDIDSQNIRCYNAGLALFSRQLERGMQSLDSLTLASLRADFGLLPSDGPEVIQQHLTKRVKKSWENMDPNFDRDDFNPLRAPDAYIESRMPGLLGVLEKFVLSRKAKTILLGNGERVRHALSETEESLKLTEENAYKRLEERQVEFRLAGEALAGFERASEPLVKEFGKDAPELLAKSFWDRLQESEGTFIADLSQQLSREIKKILISEWFNPEPLLAKLTSHAQLTMDSWLKREAQRWLADIKAGKNSTYNATLERPMRSVHRELADHWDDVIRNQIPGLEGIVIPLRDNLLAGVGVELPDSFVVVIADIVNGVSFGNAIATSSAIVVVILVFLAIFTTLSWPVLALILPALALLFPDLKGYFVNGGEGALRDKFEKAFGQIELPIKKQVESEVDDLVVNLRQRLSDEVVSHPRRVYEKRKDDSEKQFQMAEADRIQVAMKAKDTRKQHVAPLRAECETFLKEAQDLFPND
jgi:Dynamin family